MGEVFSIGRWDWAVAEAMQPLVWIRLGTRSGPHRPGYSSFTVACGGGGSPQHVLLAPDFISYREVSAGVTILCQGSGEDSLDRRITENHLGRITEVLGVKGSLSGSQGSFLKKVPCSSEIGELEEEKSPARYVSRSKTSSNPLRFCPQDTPFYR